MPQERPQQLTFLSAPAAKRCCDCHQIRPLEEFGVVRIIYRQSYCKKCCAARSKKYHTAKRLASGKPAPHRVDHSATEKACSKCKVVKPLSEYNLDKRLPPPHSVAQCRACCANYSKLYRERKGGRSYSREVVASHRQQRLGITPEQYLAMQKDQNNLCYICGSPETSTYRGITRDLAVDHDHDTGAIRDLLCGACNKGLGSFGDDPTRLERAAAYLRRHGKT